MRGQNARLEGGLNLTRTVYVTGRQTRKPTAKRNRFPQQRSIRALVLVVMVLVSASIPATGVFREVGGV